MPLLPDRDAPAGMYKQAQAIVNAEAPWIFLWVQKFPIVHTVKVKGVGSMANEKFAVLNAEPA